MATALQRIQTFGTNPIFLESQVDTDPGTLQTLLSFTVAASKERFIHKIRLTCRLTGFWEMFHNSVRFGSGRTAPGKPVDEMPLDLPKKMIASDTFELKFRQHTNKPIVKVEAYLIASENDL